VHIMKHLSGGGNLSWVGHKQVAQAILELYLLIQHSTSSPATSLLSGARVRARTSLSSWTYETSPAHAQGSQGHAVHDFISCKGLFGSKVVYFRMSCYPPHKPLPPPFSLTYPADVTQPTSQTSHKLLRCLSNQSHQHSRGKPKISQIALHKPHASLHPFESLVQRAAKSLFQKKGCFS
jgi:hypothetical protein